MGGSQLTHPSVALTDRYLVVTFRLLTGKRAAGACGLERIVRITQFCAGAAVCIATVGLASAAAATPGRAAPAPVNLIRDASAEGATPDSSGGKVHVNAWKVSHSDQFTAVLYGTSGFPDDSSPGPKHHGKNFFAGGPDGSSAKGTQVDSLSNRRHLISAGKATFTLAGWLGGFDSQRDDAMLSVTWLDTHGDAVGSVTTIGPVSVHARKDVTGMLHRHTSGSVPRRARSVLVTLHMGRADGTYNDGYADKLSLTVTHK